MMETVAPRASASFNTGCNNSETTKKVDFLILSHTMYIICDDLLTVLCENDQNLQSTFDEDFVSAVTLHCLKDGLVQGTVYHCLLEVFCKNLTVLIIFCKLIVSYIKPKFNITVL